MLAALCLALAASLGGDARSPVWSQAGGSGTRSGQVAVAPIDSQPTVAWSFGPLAFDGEPLVSGDCVIVHGRDPGGRRSLVALDLASGSMQARAPLGVGGPLQPALWSGRVAVKTGPATIEVLRLERSRWLPLRTFTHARSLSAPVVAGDALYLREGDTLACYDPERREPVWTASAQGAFRGEPAADGNIVFALCYDAKGLAHLAALAVANGTPLGVVVIGGHDGGTVPDASEPFELVVHASSVFVHFPRPLRGESGSDYSWARIPRDGSSLGEPVTLHSFLAAPVETPGGFLVPEAVSEGELRWLLATGDDGRAIQLASTANHAWLCTRPVVPASSTGAMAYIGSAAVALPSLEVCWRRPTVPDFRPVPVDGGLLVVERDVVRLLRGTPRPLTPAEEHAQALALAADDRHAERLAQLATRALRGGAPAMAERLWREAETLGAPERVLAPLRLHAERTAATPRPELDERRSKALATEERAVRARLPAELAAAARATHDPLEVRSLLAELFERSPDDAEGLELLRKRLPANADVHGADATSWLDFLAVTAALDVELVLPPDEAHTAAERRLLAERDAWRTDVIAYRSPQLFVITAGAPPGAVARALEAGELVCRILSETFPPTPGVVQEPLELVLYPSRDEYLAHGGDGRNESILGWTAGHFDPASNVTRLFLPDEDGRHARLLGVWAHELTHHWLDTRALGVPRSTPAAPGYWVVEAIATWAEELVLEPALGQWSTSNPRAASLDTLANTSERDLLAWPRLFALSLEQSRTLETRATAQSTLTWQLGRFASISPMQLFYAQGGALAHYLHAADGGRWRDVLRETVEAYYRGQALDVPRALHTTPEALGNAVREFAKNAVEPGS